MTTDEIIAKYRRHFLGLLADSYATRKQPPSELGMTMDRHTLAVEHMIRAMVNNIVTDPPKPVTKEPTNEPDQRKAPVNSSPGGAKPPQPAQGRASSPASAAASPPARR